ncbi:MAG: hypothetical protein LAP21_04065 [Acidobacteriia bacterium]|nr:hypothetical protein [Terriglobia bacterium]
METDTERNPIARSAELLEQAVAQAMRCISGENAKGMISTPWIWAIANKELLEIGNIERQQVDVFLRIVTVPSSQRGYFSVPDRCTAGCASQFP